MSFKSWSDKNSYTIKMQHLLSFFVGFHNIHRPFCHIFSYSKSIFVCHIQPKHTACMSFWMTKRQAISTDAFQADRNLYDSKIKIIFEIAWTLFEKILFIHFYPLKKAPGQSQKHFMKNFMIDFCLPLQMNTFGPKNVWFSFMG